MPSYLDFDTSKHFRDFILGKTLSAPNGPQTFTASNYYVQSTRDMANVDTGSVDSNRSIDLLQPQTSNVYKPLEYFINENINTVPRKANLSLYPYFVKGQDHGLISIMSAKYYETESELMNFAAYYISTDRNGPFFSRLEQNLYRATVGRVRLIDALEGNTSTAINILTGREPLIEKNEKITVAKTLPGKSIDFLQTVSGVEFPWSEIPGDYLSNPNNPINYRPTASTEAGKVFQDITGALGSLIGIQRRPTITRKPSDLFIEYMGDGTKSTLFNSLSYSTYAPDYTTTAMSQNSSKLLNYVDQFAQGAKNFFGLEAPKGTAYIGDDRGNDVRFAMNDFNDRPVKSNYYLSLMFDPIQAELFQRKKNISEGGGISGKLTWISSKSKNKLGINNDEFPSEQSQFQESLSINYPFREDSILGLTQEILETLPSDGGASRSHVANVIDQTSRVFRDGDVMMSRGSAVKYVDQFSKQESGVEYCRVWTKDRSYMNYSDTMKRTTGLSRKFEGSVLSTPWNLNIYPNSNGNGGFDSGSTNIVRGGDGFYAKKYMFSIENLVWKMSNIPGFTYNDLPYCERGPNGGRIMWFPPYDLKVSEQNNAKWEENIFLGRPEPVYTYQNTSRSGQVSFKVIVDHPSILNLLVKDHFKNMSDEEADNYINAFFAGCEEVDFYGLIRKYTTLTPVDIEAIRAYLNENKDPEVIKRNKSILVPIVSDTTVPKNQSRTTGFKTELYFENDIPKPNGDELKTNEKYSVLYDGYFGGQTKYFKDLNDGLRILSGYTWNGDAKNDYFVLSADPKKERPSESEFIALNYKVNDDITKDFSKLQESYTIYNNGLNTLKSELSGKTVQDIRVIIGSRTSSIADSHYNLDLAYRRSYSVITDMLDKLSKDGNSDEAISKVNWNEIVISSDIKKEERKPIVISFEDLGYKGQSGNFIIEYVLNIGEQPVGSGPNENNGMDCTDNKTILTSPALKRTAPNTFGCRESTVNVSYTTQSPDTTPPPPPIMQQKLVEITDTPSGINQIPPIDEMKKIIMKTLSECYYFKKLEEESPLQFSSLKEKLKYFHPAFHSMTPEGLNARLTFLNQCVRPGDTLPIKGISDVSDLNARNTTFGPPPILVMRIGDFYHSKIIIRDVNITFDEGIWDLNPEGIGVQPMIANVQLQVNFIGGHGLEKPVERLQNALSSNFYANTEIYDPRSTATEDRSKFTKEFLDELVNNPNPVVTSDPKDTVNSSNKIINGLYIGEINGQSLNYTSIIDNLFKETSSYFSKFIEAYNIVMNLYDAKLSSMIISPTYRTISNYTVETGAGTDTIQLLGEYKKGSELEVLSGDFKTKILDKIADENISAMLGFDKDMSAPVLAKSEDILKPYVLSVVGEMIDGITQFKSIKDVVDIRNNIIVILDKLNFMVKELHDGKLEKDITIGVNLSGYTYDKIYNTYNELISFIKDNQDKFTEDLDESFIFSKNTTMTTNDLSYFLSVLLRTKDVNILNLYKKDTIIFTDRILKNIEKRLDKFLSPYPTEKNFRIKKYPARKDDNLVQFDIVDESFIFNASQTEELINVNRTGGNKTTSVLNYFR